MTPAGQEFCSTSPASGAVVWQGRAATAADVAAAIATARAVQPAWECLPATARIARLEACARELETHGADLAAAISAETGKPRWEARGEVASMVAKVPATIAAWRARRSDTVDDHDASQVAATRYRAHGVLAVIGPFNFPGHLPHGHIVPALLAGNTVVFKPSEYTPACGEVLLDIWRRAGLPPGVVNLVQGGRDTGAAVTAHPGHDGILFTGSFATGIAIRRALAADPAKILALEMGGNNPLVVHDVADADTAATLTILSAFLTAGQRCSCARRLVVTAGPPGDACVARLVERMATIGVGLPSDEPEPFMGPVIHEAAARRLLAVQDDLIARGGVPLVRMEPQRDRLTLLSPGLIDVTAVADRDDAEWFGPLLQLIRVSDFEAAIAEANATAYGLVAGLLCDRRDCYETFRTRMRAGVVNWNQQTTGASGRLPFGGVGRSGNHRPSGAFAIDCCSYPVASLERPAVAPPATLPPGLSS